MQGGSGRDAPPDGGNTGNIGSGGSAAPADAGPAPDAGAPTPDPPTPAGCDAGPELRVLFIGNSHTYTNDLPKLVREMACAAGTKIVTGAVTPSGAAFIDHAVNDAVFTAITSDAWDFVIMHDQQQRPGHRLEDLESDHLPAVLTLVDAIRAHRPQTRPLLFMVWARRDGDSYNCEYYPLVCSYAGFTRAVSQGYRFYAERAGAELAPVALAWATVRADALSPLASTALWAGDGSHPARSGSYLAAAMLVGNMLERETAELVYDAGLGAEIAGYLRSVGDRMMREERADPPVATAERVRIACTESATCSTAADAVPVSFTLSSDSCEDLAANDAQVEAQLETRSSCGGGACTTVLLGAWHAVRGGAIEDGTYQVHAQVDVNANGVLDSGDLEACSSGNFVVGGGEDLTFTELTLR